MSARREWSDGRYVYPILDGGGNTVGWTHIPPAQRSVDYTEDPLEQQIAKLKRQLWNARLQNEKLKKRISEMRANETLRSQ